MKDIKLNIGCGSRPLADHINVDMDSMSDLKSRYPNVEFPQDIEVVSLDICNLPYEDNTVSQIRCDSLLEHLSFKEERLFFQEVSRVLRPNGLFLFSVPDFEHLVRTWLDADDDWREFYRDDEQAILQQHWFGHYSYSTKSRWGYLTASLFGPQNSIGQFHKNCYTEGKIRKLLHYINFSVEDLSFYNWKGDRDRMISVISKKLVT